MTSLEKVIPQIKGGLKGSTFSPKVPCKPIWPKGKRPSQTKGALEALRHPETNRPKLIGKCQVLEESKKSANVEAGGAWPGNTSKRGRSGM